METYLGSGGHLDTRYLQNSTTIRYVVAMAAHTLWYHLLVPYGSVNTPRQRQYTPCDYVAKNSEGLKNPHEPLAWSLRANPGQMARKRGGKGGI